MRSESTEEGDRLLHVPTAIYPSLNLPSNEIYSVFLPLPFCIIECYATILLLAAVSPGTLTKKAVGLSSESIHKDTALSSPDP